MTGSLIFVEYLYSSAGLRTLLLLEIERPWLRISQIYEIKYGGPILCLVLF